MNLFMDVVEKVILAITGAAVTFVSAYGTFYFKQMMDERKRKQFYEYIKNSVLWAEQVMDDPEGKEKYDVVYARSMEWAVSNGIGISELELKVLIEAEVKQMNQVDKKGE